MSTQAQIHHHSTRSTLALSAIYAARMLGMFMILPVIGVSYTAYKQATPELMGVAVGIYGLFQAILQIPFGLLSDKIGRKPIIVLGLCIFIVGSLVAALTDSIVGLICGRALQGAGAIGSTITALLSDLTPENKRTQAMATVGVSIGASFGLAMIIGPLLHGIGGLSAIFWLTAGMGALAIIGLLTIVPSPPITRAPFVSDGKAPPLISTLKNSNLCRLDFGIFTLHATLSALFLIIPNMMNNAGIPMHSHWMLYLPAMLVALCVLIIGTVIAEKYKRMKEVVCVSIALLTLSIMQLWLAHATQISLTLGLCLFLSMFSLLEACLPSLVSKIASRNTKGTAMGVFSTSQFLGIFIGGSIGGQIIASHGTEGIFIACLSLMTLWLLIACTMPRPVSIQQK